MREMWKDIQGYEGTYQVSNLGKVYSAKRRKLRVTPVDLRGYIGVILSKDGQNRYFGVHRLVATAFLPAQDGRTEVNHIDGDKTNNALSNLEWCTHSENVKHSYTLGERVSAKQFGKNPKAKAIINKKTGQIFASAAEVAESVGYSKRAFQKRLAGELVNDTDFAYLN